MARSILAAVARIKSELARFLAPDFIRWICHSVGHVWRERTLDPVTTLRLFALQILHGNTACPHVPRLGAVDCTGEAYGQARQRLPLAVFERLLGAIRERLLGSPTLDDGRWHGHRTFLVDGSGVSMPDTPELQKEYGQPGGQRPGCGFPVMHLLAMFHAATGLLLRVVAAPLRTHDMSRIGRLHPDLAAGDVLVGDRAFCSFAHLALLAARKVFGVFRVHQRQIVDFRPRRRSASSRSRQRRQRRRPTSRWLKRLGRHDQLVEYIKPKTLPSWMSAEAYAALPETITVRELRYTIAVPGRRTRVVTLATTLLDATRYPAAEVAALYGQRWQIETNFRHLKQTLRMDALHCKTVAGVNKELAMYAVIYNLVRLVMREASRRQNVPIERLSFIDAVRWLAEAVYAPTELKLRLVPHRPGRIEPRAVKRRPKQYDRLNRPRDDFRKYAETKQLAA
jgi:DDE family transposase